MKNDLFGLDETAGLFGAQSGEPDPGKDEQFRLARIQTFNWGTFPDLSDHAIAKEGFLFVGPSGSGKSTLLDAHAALLTPPKWMSFNVAAREAEKGGGTDRNLASYVRGAWAQQTNDNGEQVYKYLRRGTTWSAIAETYRNGVGRVVVLARVLWVKGNSTANSDVKSQYLVAEREFDLKELQFFAQSDFEVRKLRATLDDVFIKDEFSAYQDRFRHLLGIKSERALRLLHKTQSAKNLGNLNEFLRDFMLDPPETFEVAATLVQEFQVLDQAHEAVLAARNQIATLAPARDDYAEREKAQAQLLTVEEEQAGASEYREQRRKVLLEAALAQALVRAEGSRQSLLQLQSRESYESAILQELQDQRKGQGGDLLAMLDKEHDELALRRPLRLEKSALASAACRALESAQPATPHQLAAVVAIAQERLNRREEWSREHELRMDRQKEGNRQNEAKFKELREEIEAMQRQTSNIPSRQLNLRAQMAHDLGIAEEKLPFAGELLEVKDVDKAWTGALERVLRGLATSLLVEEKYYTQVAGYVNERHLGGRIVYQRMLAQSVGARTMSANSLVKKLNFAQGPHQEWLREQVKGQYADFECVESAQALRAVQRGVTLAGQVKHNSTRHEKNDQARVDNRDEWVMGFDNTQKLNSYKKQASDLAMTLAGSGQAIQSLRDEASQAQALMLHCQTLVNLTWEEIDITQLLADIDSVAKRIQAEKTARPELDELDAKISNQQAVLFKAQDKRQREAGEGISIDKEIAKYQDKLAKMPTPLYELSPTQLAHLNQRYSRVNREITLDNLDQSSHTVTVAIGSDEVKLIERMSVLKARIEATFGDFNRKWPVESEGLDAKLEAADAFFVKLGRLELDGLDKFVGRFMKLLHEQSDQNLSVLHAKLEGERKAIQERLEQVNESLRGAQYNPGTYLTIKASERMTEQVRQFRQQLRDALSNSLKDDDPVEAERRFAALNTVVQRMGSQETVDRNWRNLVLDVRQHVEFVAREFDEAGTEIEVYTSGAGKSGGQRQKLTATCLAAALKYQLGGEEQPWPVFSTVVMDEAFDKADADFTKMTMNIFKNFGFQMVVATPLKGVMTLEPFIGGACYVHIRERKFSESMVITYDSANSRLDLPQEAQEALRLEEEDEAAQA